MPKTLRLTIDYLATRSSNSEIVVVSDGSKDDTKGAAEKLFRNLPSNVTARVIEYQPNAGKGRAIKAGMTAAMGETVLFMDADYAVPLSYLEHAEAEIAKGADIAVGSRALDDTRIVEAQPFLRERFAKLFGLIQRTYLGLRLMDTQCGFKLFTRPAVEAIFPEIKLTSVIFDGEVLWLARKKGLRAVEFPVEWTHDHDTRIAYTPMKAVKVLLDMLRIPFLHMRR